MSGDSLKIISSGTIQGWVRVGISEVSRAEGIFRAGYRGFLAQVFRDVYHAYALGQAGLLKSKQETEDERY